MTHQFKFGDRVRYKSPESKLRGFVASTRNRGQNKIIVAFEGEDWLHHCSGENLELIPPPTPSASTGWPTLQTKSAASSYPPNAWSSTSTVCGMR